MSDQQKPTSGPVASAEEAPVANGDSSSGPEARSITATLGDADQQAKTALRDQQVAVAIDKAIQDSKTSSIPDTVLSHEELSDLHSSREFIQLLRSKELSVGKIKRVIKYENDLESLQIELVKMQRWIQETGQRVAILFEGRDAAGKGGTIRRFIEHLNPRAMRVVALPKPTTEETGQWYIRHLPNKGELVCFDRSWYNRAVVEPVNGFCTPEQYEQFMRQVPEFEHMLVEDGVTLIKFWFSISKDVQRARFESRAVNPLKQWKLSPLDGKAAELWEGYTKYKEAMFSRTHTSFSPWMIVKANSKRRARLESMRHVLSSLNYEGKDEARTTLIPDPNTIMRFHRSAINLD